MDMRIPSPSPAAFLDPDRAFIGLTPAAIARLAATAGDVAMVLDDEGVVLDIAVAADFTARSAFSGAVDKRWIDLVASDSRRKVEELLKDARANAAMRWREVNHVAEGEDQTPMRFAALDGGENGRLIVIGRDLRAAAEAQQRLLQAQQALERDYARLKQTELRYRILFQTSREAVIIVDAASRRVVEINPAAARLLGLGDQDAAGQPFSKLIAPEDREDAAALVATAQAAGRAPAAPLRLAGRAGVYQATADVFRQERATFVLIRIGDGIAAREDTDDSLLLEVLERMPDAFLVADSDLKVLAENAAFLDMAQIANRDQARGQPLERFIGRPGVDLPVLLANLRKHGSVRNFGTVLRSLHGSADDVSITAVTVNRDDGPIYGFAISALAPRQSEPRAADRELPRSIEQLTDLVGRVSLRDIVRETTDLIEQLCIEAALGLTGDNRASAAELLGLSRQSLYSKLHRYGMGNLTGEDE